MLLESDAPLLPSNPPRRVALYSEGVPDSEESTIAAVIRVAEGHVIWSDLLECLLDSGNSESIVLDLHPERSTPIDVPDIIFDQDQYLAEVQRAITDREWESERWRTAQLLDEYLSPGHPWSIGEELLPGDR